MRWSDKIVAALAVLDLESGCSMAEIRHTHRQLTQVWHPDRFHGKGDLEDRATRKLQEINSAYAFLKEHYPLYLDSLRQKTPTAAPPDPSSRAADTVNDQSTQTSINEASDQSSDPQDDSGGGCGCLILLVVGIVLLFFPPTWAGILGYLIYKILVSLTRRSTPTQDIASTQQADRFSSDQPSPQNTASKQGSRQTTDSKPGNATARQAKYMALQARMVELAGSETLARTLYKSLVQEYPGKGGEWYYLKAIRILEDEKKV